MVDERRPAPAAWRVYALVLAAVEAKRVRVVPGAAARAARERGAKPTSLSTG